MVADIGHCHPKDSPAKPNGSTVPGEGKTNFKASCPLFLTLRRSTPSLSLTLKMTP
jgi:hypothetical protein